MRILDFLICTRYVLVISPMLDRADIKQPIALLGGIKDQAVLCYPIHDE